MTPDDSIDLDALEAIAQAATPGRWVWDDDNDQFIIAGGRWSDSVISGGPVGYENAGVLVDPPDRMYIAMFSPDTVLELISRLKRYKARIAELNAAMVKLTNELPYPEEVRDWTEQRKKLIAEIGTLRAELAEVKR